MAIDGEMLDTLLKDCKTPADLASLHSQMLQRMINRSLEAEMDAHIGYARHDKIESGEARSNHRNGKMSKVIQSQYGDLAIDTPRDRDGSFTPQRVAKRQVRLAGMEDKIRWFIPRTRLSP